MAAPLVLPHLLDEVLDVLLGGGARLLRPSRVAQRHLLRLALALAVGDGALLLGDRALQLLLDGDARVTFVPRRSERLLELSLRLRFGLRRPRRAAPSGRGRSGG